MDNPLVSIITCTYNRAEMLKETIHSILAQEYSPVEHIVVDDGSTDDTEKAVAAYGKSIHYYSHENKGLMATLNIACRQLAQGEYIAINDDDDLMLPDRITRLYEALCRFPQAVLAVGDAEMIDAEGARSGRRITFDIKGKKDKPILIENGYKALLWPLISPATCATLFRRSDGERIGWFDEGFPRNFDTDFFARLAQLGPIVYVPRTVAYYRRGHASRWSDNIGNNLLCEYGNFMLFEKHLKSGHADREMVKRLQTRMLHALKTLVLLTHRAEDIPAGIKDDYARKGLPLLDIKKRLAYKWYSEIRFPLMNAIKLR